MPKLNMPEKMLIATDVPSCGAMLIISSCMPTLNAVPITPHTDSTAIVATTLPDTGSTSSMHAAMMHSSAVKNV